MSAGDPASIFRPDTRPAWIEAARVVAFFNYLKKNVPGILLMERIAWHYVIHQIRDVP